MAARTGTDPQVTSKTKTVNPNAVKDTRHCGLSQAPLKGVKSPAQRDTIKQFKKR